VPAGGWARTTEDEKLVKTHCCFCGQQCGIQLRVQDNKVVGFEPWEDFPFNRGKLCPKGVKRYMQDEHPDRLKHPIQRVEGVGYENISWDFAMLRVVGEIQRMMKCDMCYDRSSVGKALLGGEMRALVPAAAASTVLLCINAGLLRYVFRFDRQIRISRDMYSHIYS